MPRSDAIELVPYDPAWPGLFAEENFALTALLAPHGLVAIEHIGSTAVPGLEAKPVLDMMAGFDPSADREQILAPLSARGYRHWRDDPTRAERFFFVKGLPPDAARRTHHLHAVVYGGDWWRRHLQFRDALRATPRIAAEYVVLKRTLAARFADDREAYTDGKRSFVEAVLAGRPSSTP